MRLTGPAGCLARREGEDPLVLIGDHGGRLHALHALTGETAWSTRCGSAIRCTAALAPIEGMPAIFLGSYGPWLCRLDLEGRIVWRRRLPKHEYVSRTKKGIVSSPLLADIDGDGRLEVVTGSRSSRIYAADAQTGRLKWFRELAYDTDASPSFATIDGVGHVFVGGGEHTSGQGDNALIALRGSDGAELWRAPLNGAIDSCAILAAPNSQGGADPADALAFATTLASPSLVAVRARDGSEAWRHAFGPTATCDHASGQCVPKETGVYFTEHAVCRSYTVPLIADLDGDGRDEVFAGSNNGELVMLDAETGQVRAHDRLEGMVRGSPILADLDGDGISELVVCNGDRLEIFRTTHAGAPWTGLKGEPTHQGRLRLDNPAPEPGPRQSWLWPKLVWSWLVVDSARFALFHFERRIASRFGVRFRRYYY
nr:PQQ-binding-like beta-propeller repeat protein [Oceanicaulis alexandrii]